MTSRITINKFIIDFNKIDSLSQELDKLTIIPDLHLECNRCPNEIGMLTNMTYFKLNGTCVDALPKEIGNLKSLINLELRGNNLLKCLPKTIGSLTSLTNLKLDDNSLKSLPLEIGNLTNLKELWLTGNSLTSLPVEIGNLTNLTELYLDCNKLTSLPKEIGNLTNLSCLTVSSNKLTEIPTEIGNIINLTNCVLAFNRITVFPKELCNITGLTHLDLADNNIRYMPLEIVNLRHLTYFSYSSNPIENLLNPIIYRFITNLGRGNLKKTKFYDDSQNVHNSSIQNSIRDSIFNLMANYKPDYNFKFLDSDILTSTAKEALVEFSNYEDVHSIMNISFKELLRAVFIELDTLDTAEQKVVLEVMNQEMEDSICKCFTGRISRLVNCLSGFSSKVSVQISKNEELSNIIVVLRDKISDIDQLKLAIMTEMKERGYDKETIDEWLEYVD